MLDSEQLRTMSSSPGVYLMKDAAGDVLYVGKANNLKQRLKQYFSGHDRREQLPYLLEKVVDIETIVVHSEKEALLLENTLIKKHKPRYNILLKDDKGYISVKISSKHDFPSMQLVRYKGKVPKDGTYYGPYTSAFQAREAFDLLSRTFPLRQCSDEEFARRTRPCLLYQIKRCPAPCVGYIEKKPYRELVSQAEALLSGRGKELISALKAEMKEASDALEFERASELLTKIRLLERLSEKQEVLSVDIRDTDAIALYRQGPHAVITTLYYRNSALVGTHHFLVEDSFHDDGELLESYLVQHYLVEVPPQEIVLAYPLQSVPLIEEVLSENKRWKGRMVVGKTGQRAAMAELALKNAKSHLTERMLRKERDEQFLLDVKEALQLRHYPKRIECFDNSHLAGEEKVSSMVVFVNGIKAPQAYRKWKIKTVEKADDYAMMREVLLRRFATTGDLVIPDLVIIDGGKGHLHAAQKVLSELGIISCSLIALAKEEGRHDRGITAEVVHVADYPDPIRLDTHSKVLQFLQRIRDEAHRFVISFHRKRREKNLTKSVLDQVEGIGPVKKKRLLRLFGSVQAIAQASCEELMQVPGISEQDAKRLVEALKK